VERFLVLFVDGVGLAPAGTDNPLSSVAMPALNGLLGGPLTTESLGRGELWRLATLDASLGVPGLPQSATGQTALFTGENAPAALGRHVPAFPGPRLAALIAEKSILRRAVLGGRRATFANPYSQGYFDEVEARRRRHSATTLTALAAPSERASLRDLGDLARGEACAWDVTRESFRESEPTVETVAAEEAGRHLAAVAEAHDLTLWETFMTDLAGHRRRDWTAAEALGRLDGLIAGLLAARPAELTVLMVSDHGNLEEAGHRQHTKNPVPLLAIGPGAEAFAGLSRIDQVTPRLLAGLDLGS
jgi:hypothetical protein